ncbi:MAG: hypothetical protein Q9168_005147 [Polycauliona sp. 1 TL-2023]
MAPPHTPSGPSEPRLPSSADSASTASGLGRSSTRSGRSYLPSDAGISTESASRRQETASRLANLHDTPSRQRTRVEVSSDALQTSIGKYGESTLHLSPGPVQTTWTEPLVPGPDFQTLNRSHESNKRNRQSVVTATDSFTVLQNEPLQNGVPPASDPNIPITTTDPKRLTAMTREHELLLSPSYEERHTQHQANSLPVSDSTQDWFRDNTGSHSPSPPPYSQTVDRMRWNMAAQPVHRNFFADSPETFMQDRDSMDSHTISDSRSLSNSHTISDMSPQPEPESLSTSPESFFADAYKSTTQDRDSIPDSEPQSSHMGIAVEPAISGSETVMITAPYSGIPIIPPKTSTTYSYPRSEEAPNIYPNCHAHSLIHEEVPSRETPDCIRPRCPLFPLPHRDGHYLHNGLPAAAYLPTFGTSNPPPIVWQAIHNGCCGMGTQQDADIIARFLEYHVEFCSFSVVPDGNFVWGQEIPAGGLLKGRPWVRMPDCMTIPVRIKFDARWNIPGLEVEAEYDALGKAEEKAEEEDGIVRDVRGVMRGLVAGEIDDQQGGVQCMLGWGVVYA